MAMFQEDLGSKEHLPIIPPPTEVLAESERVLRRPPTTGSSGGEGNSRKNSVKRKPVGSAPSLPKLNLSSDNSSTENLVSSLKIQDDSSSGSDRTKTQARLRGPRQRPHNLSMHNIHIDPLQQQRQTQPPSPIRTAPKRKPVGGGGGPSSATSSGADSSSFTQSPPSTPPPVPPKETGNKKDRWSQQFVDFPGVQGALEGNPLAMQISPPRKHSTSAEYDDSSDEENEEDDNDEAFERRAIASGTIRGKNRASYHQDKRASLNHVRYWKYHVLKYSKDLYLTTNPDHNHLSRPVAPSYYVDLHTEPLKLVFNSMEEGAPEMTVTRAGNAFELIISCTSEGIIWSGTAIETQAQMFLPGRKRPVKCRQYTYRDDYGVEWVIGNRLEYTTTYDVNRNPIGNYAKVSSKVYFFIRSDSNNDVDDTILAVLRRRHPKHKRMLKENFSKFFDHEDSNNNTAQQPSSEVADDDADNEKIGWLYMLDTIVQQQQARNQPHLWKIVTAFTLAVSYSLRVEEKDKSLQQRFSNFKRKAIRSVNPH